MIVVFVSTMFLCIEEAEGVVNILRRLGDGALSAYPRQSIHRVPNP